MAKKVTHVFFDVDGLLLDTEGIYSQIFNTLAEKHGKKFTTELKRKQMGKSQEEAGKIFIKELGLDISLEEYKKDLDALEKAYFPESELLPGAEKLIRHLAANGIPMAIATGSSEESLGWKTQKHSDLFGLFSHVVCGSDKDLLRCKPAPDIYLLAKKRFGDCHDNGNCLVFEDSENGVVAGLAAEMNVAWVPDYRFTQDRTFEGPVYKLLSLTEFVPEEFGLPKFE